MEKGAFLAKITADPLGIGNPDDEYVRKWRNMLRQKNFVVAATGAFDRKLANATMVAQAWSGVAVDGLVGPITWHAFRKKRRSPKPITTILSWLGSPKITDCRYGRNGYARHASRRWASRSFSGIVAKLGHYTGGPASFRADAEFHVHSNYLTAGGAPAIAYTLGVDKSGELCVFNDPSDLTWHCDGGKNAVTLGIVFRGGAEGPSLAQRRTLKWLWSQLEAGTFAPFGVAFPRLSTSTTHQHVNSTDCPGAPGEAFYRSISPVFRTAI